MKKFLDNFKIKKILIFIFILFISSILLAKFKILAVEEPQIPEWENPGINHSFCGKNILSWQDDRINEYYKICRSLSSDGCVSIDPKTGECASNFSKSCENYKELTKNMVYNAEEKKCFYGDKNIVSGEKYYYWLAGAVTDEDGGKTWSGLSESRNAISTCFPALDIQEK